MKKDDHFYKLLEKTNKSPLEKRLLEHLYQKLKEDHAHQLHAQYDIDFEDDWVSSTKYTISDFAFPDMQIAIYCDGYNFHKEGNPFWIDRSQSRRLQLKGWIVLRFAGNEIRDFIEIVLQMIQQAIGKREQQQKGHKKTIEEQEGTIEEQQKKISGLRIWRYATAVLGAGLLTAIALFWLNRSTPEPSDVHIPGEFALIPAGEFRMGGSDSDAEVDEHPEHTVHVDAFFIDKYEVTNAQYKQFIDANPQWQKDRIPSEFHNGRYLNLWQDNTYPPDKENHPVVYVS